MKLFHKNTDVFKANPSDFHSPLLRLQERPPSPLRRRILYVLLTMLSVLFLWAIFGKLEIVAVADGKLVPQSYLQIVQPAESGIVKEILVAEGANVRAGQVLMRMDAVFSDADLRAVEAELARKQLSLRRIDAELGVAVLSQAPDDSPSLFKEMETQLHANQAAFEAALAAEGANRDKAQRELAAAQTVRDKLAEVLPHYKKQEAAFEKLSKEGFAGPLMASDKQRERIEKEKELEVQEQLIVSARASIAQSDKKSAQIRSDYRRNLYAERNAVQAELEKLIQERSKNLHRQGLMELKAPQDGIVKDVATHTTGTVVQPGTVMLTVVPQDQVLHAEVWVSNEDIGFVRPGLPVKVKFAAFPFQKFGMVEGTVEYVSADASERSEPNNLEKPSAGLSYRAMIKLKAMNLDLGGQKFMLTPGMQTSAEILIGERTVMEYLLSPVQTAWHDAGRER